jgi:hypothetical protein
VPGAKWGVTVPGSSLEPRLVLAQMSSHKSQMVCCHRQKKVASVLVIVASGCDSHAHTHTARDLSALLFAGVLGCLKNALREHPLRSLPSMWVECPESGRSQRRMCRSTGSGVRTWKYARTPQGDKGKAKAEDFPFCP